MSKKDSENSFDSMVGNAETSTDVVEATGPAFVREYSDTPEFDKSDIAWPRLRLAQGLTQEVSDGFAKAGDWVISGYDPETEVVVIPLLYAKFWEKKGDDDLGVPVPYPGADSPDIKWRANPRDSSKNLPPITYPVFSYVCYSTTHDALVSVDFKKTSTNVAQFINSMINSKSLGNFAVKLGARVQTNAKKQQFYTATVTVQKVPAEELSRAKSMLATGSSEEDTSDAA